MPLSSHQAVHVRNEVLNIQNLNQNRVGEWYLPGAGAPPSRLFASYVPLLCVRGKTDISTTQVHLILPGHLITVETLTIGPQRRIMIVLPQKTKVLKGHFH